MKGELGAAAAPVFGLCGVTLSAVSCHHRGPWGGGPLWRRPTAGVLSRLPLKCFSWSAEVEKKWKKQKRPQGKEKKRPLLGGGVGGRCTQSLGQFDSLRLSLVTWPFCWQNKRVTLF